MFGLTILWQRAAFYGAVVALLVGLGAGTCWYFVADKIAELKAEKNTLSDALEAANDQRKLDAAVLTRHAASSAATARETAAVRTRTGRALSANRQWADQPLPKEVIDALR